MWIAVRFVVNNPVRDHPAITERGPHIALHQRNLRRLVQLTGQRHGEAARIPRPGRKLVQPVFAMLDRVPEPLGYPRHGGPLHRRFGHIRTLRLHVGAHQAQRVCECGMPESVLRPLRGVFRQGNFRMHHGLRLVRKRRGFPKPHRHHAHRMPIGRGAHRAAACAGGDNCRIQIKSGHAVAQRNRRQKIRKDFLCRRALLIFA